MVNIRTLKRSAFLVIGVLGAIFFSQCQKSQKTNRYISNYFDDPQVIAFISLVIDDDYDQAKLKFNDGVDINRLGKKDVTPFQWFFVNDAFLSPRKFNYLLSLDPDVLLVSPRLHWSAFHESARLRNTHYLSYFLHNLKIDPNIRTSHESSPTALFIAVNNWNFEAMNILIDAGIDVNALGSFHRSALSATLFNNWEAAYILLEAGADPKYAPKIVYALENYRYFPPKDGSIDWRAKVIDQLRDQGLSVSPWDPSKEEN